MRSVWNQGDIKEVHEEVKKRYGFEEPDLDMKISLYVIIINGLIYERLEWSFRLMIGSNGKFGGYFFLLMK